MRRIVPLDLQLVTPERELVHEKVDEVQIPGKDGFLGILPGHAALLGQLGSGVLSYRADCHQRQVTVRSGFLEVLDDHVRVLADAAEKVE